MGLAVSALSSVDRGASGVPSRLHLNVATPAAAPSSGEIPYNLHGLRRCFPDRWAAFLRAHFQGATHVAAFFGVDDHTARAWLNGKHGVNAAPVVMAMRLIPGAADFLLEAA